jgi:glycosyltransferase involved in cell wall biosynthesis
LALTREQDLNPSPGSDLGLTAARVSQPSVDVRLVGFRYHPAIGGAEQHARRLLREIGDRLSVDVTTIVTENRSDWLHCLVNGVRDHEEHYLVDGRDVRALARWPDQTRRRLSRLSPLYHLPMSPVPSMMGRTLTAELDSVAQGARIVHNVFMGREAFSLGLLLAARRAGSRFLFTPLRHQRPLGWNSPAFQQIYRDADRVVALTSMEADWLARQGAPRERLRVIGVGPLSDPEASPAQAREALGERRIVLFLGQLHNYKGFRQLLQAARLMADRRDVVFAFAGPDIRGHARAFSGASGNIRYLGRVDDAMRNALLTACTVLCVPSSRESFGGAMIDAWACGKPVIGGPAEATRELIAPGVDGWIVPQDPPAIAARIASVLDDPELARRVGAAGRAKVESRFSWSSIASAYLALYQELGVSARSAR